MSENAPHQRFFLVDEKHVNVKGVEITLPNVLYFEFYRPSREPRGVPYELTAKATKEHVQQYANDYRRFKASNPDYKLPWGEDEAFVGVKAQAAGETSFVEKIPEPIEEPVVETVEVIQTPIDLVVEPEINIEELKTEEVKSEEIVGNPNE